MGQILTIPYHLFDQAYPPAPSFSFSDIPDQTGIVSIITGGSSGLGYEIAKALIAKNGTVYLAARDKAKAEKAIERLVRETGGKEPTFLSLDLEDLGSIEKAVEEFSKYVFHGCLDIICLLIMLIAERRSIYMFCITMRTILFTPLVFILNII